MTLVFLSASLPDLMIRFSHFKGQFMTFNPDYIGSHRSPTFDCRKNDKFRKITLPAMFKTVMQVGGNFVKPLIL